MAHRLEAMFRAAGIEQPEDTIGFLLWRVAHRHQREVDRLVAPLGLTHLQFAVLVQAGWLARDGATLTQPGLARYSKIHPMQLSSVLKALETKALITRMRQPGNTRVNEIVLTDTAVDLLAAAIPRTTALQEQFFGLDPAFGADLHARLRQVVMAWGNED